MLPTCALPWWCGRGGVRPCSATSARGAAGRGIDPAGRGPDGVVLVRPVWELRLLTISRAIEGDREFGLKSLPVAFGIDGAKYICAGLIDVTQIAVAVYLFTIGLPDDAPWCLGLLDSPADLGPDAVPLKDPVKYDVKYQGTAPFLVFGIFTRLWRVAFIPRRWRKTTPPLTSYVAAGAGALRRCHRRHRRAPVAATAWGGLDKATPAIVARSSHCPRVPRLPPPRPSGGLRAGIFGVRPERPRQTNLVDVAQLQQIADVVRDEFFWIDRPLIAPGPSSVAKTRTRRRTRSSRTNEMLPCAVPSSTARAAASRPNAAVTAGSQPLTPAPRAGHATVSDLRGSSTPLVSRRNKSSGPSELR